MLRHLLLISRHDTCRGPLAGALLQQAVPQLVVKSAGWDARVGAPAGPLARNCAKALGLDLSQHRAQSVSADLCQRADLVLAFTPREQAGVQSTYPSTRGRTFLLGQFRWTELPEVETVEPPSRESLIVQLRLAVRDWVECLGHVVGQPPERQPRARAPDWLTHSN